MTSSQLHPSDILVKENAMFETKTVRIEQLRLNFGGKYYFDVIETHVKRFSISINVSLDTKIVQIGHIEAYL